MMKGRVGTLRAALVCERPTPGTVVFTCRNNPEFRLTVDTAAMTAEGYAADSSSNTAGGEFAVSKRGERLRIDHSTALWFWLEF